MNAIKKQQEALDVRTRETIRNKRLDGGYEVKRYKDALADAEAKLKRIRQERDEARQQIDELKRRSAALYSRAKRLYWMTQTALNPAKGWEEIQRTNAVDEQKRFEQEMNGDGFWSDNFEESLRQECIADADRMGLY